MKDWQKSHSTVKPDKIDSTSSEIYVYVRKDIIEIPIEDSDDVMYEYLEKKMTKDEFIAYSDLIHIDEKADEVEAQALYTALMTDTLIEEE